MKNLLTLVAATIRLASFSPPALAGWLDDKNLTRKISGSVTEYRKNQAGPNPRRIAESFNHQFPNQAGKMRIVLLQLEGSWIFLSELDSQLLS